MVKPAGLFTVCAALLGLALAGPSRAQGSDPWRPLERFVGEWRGTATGQAGNGEVVRRYAKVMGGRFIQETNTSTYAPQEKNKKGEVHEHAGMFSYDKQRKLLVLRQFHIEGFVNTYKQVSDGSAARLVFESEAFENFSNAWKARETYEFDGDERLIETFELAAPGKEFQVYSRTELTRAR
ncbi:MAG: hypothetical protein WAQ05_12500 [Rubrivivax sp.]